MTQSSPNILDALVSRSQKSLCPLQRRNAVAPNLDANIFDSEIKAFTLNIYFLSDKSKRWAVVWFRCKSGTGDWRLSYKKSFCDASYVKTYLLSCFVTYVKCIRLKVSHTYTIWKHTVFCAKSEESPKFEFSCRQWISSNFRKKHDFFWVLIAIPEMLELSWSDHTPEYLISHCTSYFFHKFVCIKFNLLICMRNRFGAV